MDEKIELLDVICIPVSEYKKLVRCETSLRTLFAMNIQMKYSSEVAAMVEVLSTMHQDLLPKENKEVTDNAE